jgi:hypothetical protein
MKPVLLASVLLVATSAAQAQTTTLRERYDLPPIPRGYARVWEDDRLNPNRAVGTAAGEAQMYAIWTDDVPMQMRPLPDPVTTTTLRSARVFTEDPGVFVQVNVVTEPEAAVRRLQTAGIPAKRGVLRSGAGDANIVLAGPYGDRASAEAAVGALQRMGYSGRVLRN